MAEVKLGGSCEEEVDFRTLPPGEVADVLGQLIDRLDLKIVRSYGWGVREIRLEKKDYVIQNGNT